MAVSLGLARLRVVVPEGHRYHGASFPSEVKPWCGIMERNSPGLAPAGAPVFIAQGMQTSRCGRMSPSASAKHLLPRGACGVLLGVMYTFAARDSGGTAVNCMTEMLQGCAGTLRFANGSKLLGVGV
jgi:hypothetical protein